MLRRVDTALRGPHLRLPRPLDACSEWWARRPPRVRAVLGALLVVTVVLGVDARIRAVEARWGGSLQRVAVASADLDVGEAPQSVRLVRLPPAAVPPAALEQVPRDAVLSMPAPRGTVLTRKHFHDRGPGEGLPAGMRAVPIPTEPGWGVRQGGWVDVWTLGSGEEPAALVARGRPVVQVRADAGGLTSLVGLTTAEVEAVTAGLALGRVLLTHAPAPEPD